MLSSGIFDVNGIEICVDDVVRMTIPLMYQKPIVVDKKVVFYKGAFRFKDDRELFQSCIGDVAPNVTLEVIKELERVG